MTARRGSGAALGPAVFAALAVILILTSPAPASPQRPEVDLPVMALDSFVLGLVAGAGAAYSIPGGEAFEHLDGGAGYELFAGVRLSRAREIRVGWLRTWHDDVVNGGAVSLRGLFAEMRWALARGRLLLRAAPRLAFLMLRAQDLTQSGPTIGATLAPQLRLGRGWLVDAGASVDFGTFPPRPPNNPRDERPGTVWSLRLGVAWEP